MAAKKVIAVIGATGNQGGSLVRAVLKEGDKSQFIVRAITRDISSEKALALKKAGVHQLAQADASSNERSLAEAIKGCHGMYCVTALNLAHPEKEKQQAEIMAIAAKKAGIKHVIWSTLEDTRKAIPLESDVMPTLLGRFKVPHFDTKSEADKYFAQLPTTYLMSTFYWDNFAHRMTPRKGRDGRLYITSCMKSNTPLLGIASDDIGKCALGIFKQGQNYINERVGIYGEALTLPEMTARISKALGQPINYHEVSFDFYRGIRFPGALEFGNMYQYFHERQFFDIRSMEETRKLNPDVMTFDQWLAKNKNRIPISHE